MCFRGCTWKSLDAAQTLSPATLMMAPASTLPEPMRLDIHIGQSSVLEGPACALGCSRARERMKYLVSIYAVEIAVVSEGSSLQMPMTRGLRAAAGRAAELPDMTAGKGTHLAKTW